MILQSPESAMPEPYATYVKQRSEAIAAQLVPIVGDTNVQLCPRAILQNEQVFADDPEAIVYGSVVPSHRVGTKAVLYPSETETANGFNYDGIATSSVDQAKAYAKAHLERGNLVRLKKVEESDGLGQYEVSDVEQLLEHMDGQTEFIVMPQLRCITDRGSLGRILLGKHGNFGYLGRESTTTVDGREAYGGTEIGLYRLGDSKAQSIVADYFRRPYSDFGAQYIVPCYAEPTLERYMKQCKSVGRVSLDILCGQTHSGIHLNSVVDVTPRVGGVTPAEVLAIHTLIGLGARACFASSRLLYNPSSRPRTGINFVDTDSLVINANIEGVTH